MSAAAEAARHMHALAAPWRPGDGVKAAIRRAALRAGLPAGLAKRLWYGEARRIDAETMDRLRAAAREAHAVEAARDEYQTLLTRIAACEAALGLSGADVGRAAPHGRRGMAGAQDRAVARGPGRR